MPAPTAPNVSDARVGHISLRVPDAAKAIIDRAAQITGRSRTDFMVEAARRAAEDTIADQTVIAVDPQTFDAFVAALDRPAQANDRLRAMLNTPAPWDVK